MRTCRAYCGVGVKMCIGGYGTVLVAMRYTVKNQIHGFHLRLIIIRNPPRAGRNRKSFSSAFLQSHLAGLFQRLDFAPQGLSFAGVIPPPAWGLVHHTIHNSHFLRPVAFGLHRIYFGGKSIKSDFIVHAQSEASTTHRSNLLQLRQIQTIRG